MFYPGIANRPQFTSSERSGDASSVFMVKSTISRLVNRRRKGDAGHRQPDLSIASRASTGALPLPISDALIHFPATRP
ncbi:hypothetical protein J6590_054330 [Homalodisca vitripennis]|nr:hypothetical protein J6590_054330 [Homalodisca vitripennis]